MRWPSQEQIEQMEGVNREKSTYGEQWIFQPGYHSLYIEPLLTGVNQNFLMDDVSAGTLTNYWARLTPALDTTNVGFKWGEVNTTTIQNHSPMPVYVTAYYCEMLDDFPVGLSAVNAKTAHKEPIIDLIAETWLAYSGALPVQAMQGYYDSNLLTYGEGTNVVPPGTKAQVTYLASAPIIKGLGIPIGGKWTDIPEIKSLIRVYEQKKFVLAPGECTSLVIQDKDLKFRMNVVTANMGETNPWDTTYFNHNKYGKFIAFEFTGSMIGKDLQSLTTAADNEVAWAVDSTDTQQLNLANVYWKVSTHGGSIYVMGHRSYNVGVLTNLPRDKETHIQQNVLVATPDQHYSRVSEIDIQ